MSQRIRVVMIPADRPPYVTNINGSMRNIRKIVGGYAEIHKHGNTERGDAT